MSKPSANAIDALLETSWLGRVWRYLEVCASTNDEAAAWARDAEQPAPHGGVVVAETQTGGRGRLGRRWHSPPGENLYLSVVLRPPPSLEPRALPPLTLVTAVALAETIAAFDVEPDLRWPNDVCVEGRKLAGVLTEMSCQGERVSFVVVGIGVNLNARGLPPELAERATTLTNEAGVAIDRAAFAAELCRRMERWYDTFIARGSRPVVAAWKLHSHMLGQPVTIGNNGDPDGQLTGIAEDLDGDGALRVRTPDGHVRRVLTGEVLP